MKRVIIELHVVVHARSGDVEPANSMGVPSVTAGQLATRLGVYPSMVVKAALRLGICSLAYDPIEVALITEALGEGPPPDAA
jgi:hypothetical protein